MTRKLTVSSDLDTLKNEARRWLNALQANDSAAIARYRRAIPKIGPESPTLRQVQHALALEHGFPGWTHLKSELALAQQTTDEHKPKVAEGEFTDDLLEVISRQDGLVKLELQGSKQVTDSGLRHLAGLPSLEYLDLSGCQVSDSGLAVLRHLPNLKTFRLRHYDGITDAGASHLAHCDSLEFVDLMGTPTGDAAIAALAGKRQLCKFHAGNNVTDSGLALFHKFPAFKIWQGSEPVISLMDFSVKPSYLFLNLKAPFTDSGLASLAGLDGLFALNLFGTTGSAAFESSHSAVTPQGIRQLGALENLGWLGCCAGLGSDESLRHIAAMPRMRALICQDAVAGDDGFEALSHSSSIEYIWGRRCYNLTGRGFSSLSRMPNLRGLSVSCKNVDDDALSTLPTFPSLREFMPMDVPDQGFRYVGKCHNLEDLWCMYCRDTTDVATEHLAGLQSLKTYYAGSTAITDRSLRVLSGLRSLEHIELHQCSAITNTGIAYLASLPNLRELQLSGLPLVTQEAPSLLPATVRVFAS